MAALIAILFALVFLAPPPSPTPTFPRSPAAWSTTPHVLTPDIQADLTSKLAALEAKTGTQLVVVTLPSLQGDDIADYGYQLGRAWGIGQKGKNTGALFIVAPSEKKTRIEVGYGLEGVLTDALSSVILNSQVLPRFRQGDVSGRRGGGHGRHHPAARPRSRHRPGPGAAGRSRAGPAGGAAAAPPS